MSSQENRHDRLPLECIGSFDAHTPEGEHYTIEIWTRHEAVHDRERQRIHPGLLVLTTTDGYGVERVSQGEYCLTESPEVRLSTNDPLAP
jgi:hypothetical protein